MTLTQEITLDIYDPPYFEYINAKQLDNVSRVLIITLTANGSVLKPDAETETAVFRALKPRSGASVLNPAIIGEDGRITVKLTDQTLAEDGKVEADVSIVRGDEVLSSATMYIQVTRAPVSDKQITSTDEFLVMTEATAKAKAAAKAADDAAGRADTAAQLLEGMTVTAEDVEPGGSPTAELTEKDGRYDLALGLPRGRDGQVQSVNGGTGDVVIGVRNLVLDSKGPFTKAASTGLVYSNSEYMTFGLSKALTAGRYYTASFDVLSTGAGIGQLSVALATAGFDCVELHTFDIIDGKVAAPMLAVNDGLTQLLVYIGVDGHTEGNFLTISDVKLEEGNVSTDWMPAPEDAQEIGGRNLINLDSLQFMDCTYSLQSTDNIQFLSTDPYMGSGIKINGTFEPGMYVLTFKYTDKNLSTNILCSEGLYGFQLNENYMPTYGVTYFRNFLLSTGVLRFEFEAKTTFSLGIVVSGPGTMSGLKLERGNVATDWSPAPEDLTTSVNGVSGAVQISGRNLLLRSNDHITTSKYLIGLYYYGDEIPVEGAVYTCTIKGNLGAGRERFGIYNNLDTCPLGMLSETDEPGIYRITFTWTNEFPVGAQAPTALLVFHIPAGLDESTIEWIKLERGNTPTAWSPAPEDKADADKVVSSYNGQTGDIVSGAECNNLFLDTGYWEFGGLRGESAVGTSYKDTEFSNDEISSGAVFIRTKTPIKIPSSMKVSFNDEKYIVYILYYDREKKYLGRASGWLYKSGYRFSASVENPAEYAGFILEGTKAAISPDDAADINLRIVNETIPDDIEARLAALEAAAGITYEPPVTDGPEIVGGEDVTR